MRGGGERNGCLFNPLPGAKILDVTKLKAFADDNKNIAQMLIPA